MSKKILFGNEARNEIKVGIDAVANAVKITLGPKGRNVAMDKGYGGPTVTNDGVSIAREIILEDPIHNLGASLIKDVANKTNDSAGDGTTTSVILTHAIIEEGLKNVSSGINVVGIKNGIGMASKAIVESLKKLAKPIKSDEEITQVATISSESEEIGKMLSETISKLGADAVITVESSPVVGITSDVSQGMEFDKGFVSPYMVTDSARMEAECRDVKILVTDMKIGPIQEMIPILELIMKTGKKEFVIIADDVLGESLQTFVVNKIRGALSVLAIKAPGFGNRKKDYLEDIATITGATFISAETGTKLDKVTMEDLGSADRVVATKDKTTIVGGQGTKEAIANRIALARKEMELLESKHDKLKVEERIAKLSGGVAVIKVGGSTEVETGYLKLKIEDAVGATKAALGEGVVAGGGVALIRAIQMVKKPFELTADEEVGFNMVLRALEAPLKQIAVNCGRGDGSSTVEHVMAMVAPNGGFDALKGVYVEDMFVAGIIDPVKVTRNCVENATSSAGTFLTTEVAIAEQPKVLPDDKQ